MEVCYRIIMVLTGSSVQALDIDDSGNAKPVSINGNVSMSYKDKNDMDVFVQHIKDSYSIEDFSDDSFAALVVNCGADAEIAEYLHELTVKAADSSLIRAEYVVPFIAAGKCKLKKGEVVTVSILGMAYTICTDETGRAVCFISANVKRADGIVDTMPESAAANANNPLVIEPADFAALVAVDTGLFGSDEEVLKQKDTQIAELRTEYEQKLTAMQKKAAQESAEYQRQLTEERENIKKERDKYQQSLTTERRKIKKLKTKRSICWVYYNDDYSSDYTNQNIKLLYQDGAIVDIGSNIAQVIKRRSFPVFNFGGHTENIKAPNSGKIFYLTKDDAVITEDMPIAIIGSEGDTRSDVETWFSSVREVLQIFL